MSSAQITPLAPFRSRDFTLLWLGNFASLTGTEMTRAAVSWQSERTAIATSGTRSKPTLSPPTGTRPRSPGGRREVLAILNAEQRGFELLQEPPDW